MFVQSQLRLVARNATSVFAMRLLLFLLQLRTRLLRLRVWRDVLETSLRWAAFAAGLSFFRLLQRFLRHNQTTNRLGLSRDTTTFLSGFVCSLSGVALHPSTREEMSLYMIMRALHGWLTSPQFMARLPGPLQRFEHYDTIGVGLSSMQLLGALIYSPHTHSKGYLRFLELSMHKHPLQVRGIEDWFHLHRTTDNGVKYLTTVAKTTVTKAASELTMCEWYHPNFTSCLDHWVWYIGNHFVRRDLPLYLPLKVSLALIFNFKKVVADPIASAKRIAKSTAVSSAFLAVYCANAVCVLCALRHNVKNTRWWMVGPCMGAAAGAATLIEEKARRLDLALYCGMQAVRSGFKTLIEWGLAPKLSRRWFSVLLAASLAYLLMRYDREPETLHRNVTSGFNVFFHDRRHHSNNTQQQQQQQERRQQPSDEAGDRSRVEVLYS